MIRSEIISEFYNHCCKVVFSLLLNLSFFICKSQTKDTIQTLQKVSSESLHFTAHLTEYEDDGSMSEIDTSTGYRKYYYYNGKLKMEGKVTKTIPKDYRDGIWKYYNEAGELMNQETYTKEGKINQLKFLYSKNGKPMSEIFQYYEGDDMKKSTFKFHKIEKLFYTNGQLLSERHFVNNAVVEVKCWDSKGNPQPVEFLKTIESVEVNE